NMSKDGYESRKKKLMRNLQKVETPWLLRYMAGERRGTTPVVVVNGEEGGGDR
ncbi:hypothetical protein U1Q18_001235, partial [Sarracenia purpurea var. burkii]